MGLTAEVWVNKATLEASSPTVTGTKPLRSRSNHRSSAQRDQPRAKSTDKMKEGRTKTQIAKAPAHNPAMRQPTSATKIVFGPGAACASAKSAAKSSAPIQPFSTTTTRCNSATTT